MEKLENYLKNFLLHERNNEKIVMLSGVWGAGKTHFWKEKLEKEKDNDGLYAKLKEQNKSCVYISLYGKEDIETIKNEILVKSYEIIKGEDKLKKRAISAFGLGTKSLSFSFFGVKVNTKEFTEKFEEYSQENMEEEAKSYLADGGIICFDDFERKSKKIDLNDLFGFITQLSIDMNCKIVIILNSDVFKEEEAKIFQNVKEKTVNKFLKFNPSKEELFEIIFSQYSIDEKSKDILFKSIDEMDILNARVYKNVFENFEELIEKYPNLKDSEIRFFVLSFINFNLTHKIFKFYDYIRDDFDLIEVPKYFVDINDISIRILERLERDMDYNFKFELISDIKSEIENNINIRKISEEILKSDLEVLNKYEDDIWNYWKLDKILDFRKDVSLDMQKTINDFIENGYL